eukprot:818779-Pelagomonas_calceolata.AAC.1
MHTGTFSCASLHKLSKANLLLSPLSKPKQTSACLPCPARFLQGLLLVHALPLCLLLNRKLLVSCYKTIHTLKCAILIASENRKDGTNVGGWHWVEKDMMPWSRRVSVSLCGGGRWVGKT